MKALDEYNDAFEAYVSAYDRHQASASRFLPQSWTASGRRVRETLQRLREARRVVLFGRPGWPNL